MPWVQDCESGGGADGGGGLMGIGVSIDKCITLLSCLATSRVHP